ncbi:MAG TPA: MFS transporter [Micromonosporaceae bacterium]|nr:MFS transporter [Micromonosporaceae bacterium]HCU48532.1 MFS transporter [Micromonosporaceae bacterium]
MTTVEQAPSFAAASSAVYRWRWIAFGVVIFAGILDLLDSLITTIAAPAIRAGLGGGNSMMQWLTAGYTLALSSGLIVGGRLGDIYGRKKIFLIGLGGFTVMSLLCGIAPDPALLVLFRVLQGLFGAVMLPQGLGFFKEMFPPRELGTVFGFIGPVMGMASVGGPILGGWLLSANLFGLGWRMIFLINLPLGLIALALAIKYLPESRKPTAARLDWTGATIVSVAALLLIFPVVQGHEIGWPLWTFAVLLLGVALFGVFGWYEIRHVRRGGEPLVIPSLFRKRAFTGGLVGGLSLFGALMGFSLVLTIYVQVGLGFSPLAAAMTVLPVAGGEAVGLVIARMWLADRLGRKLIHIGVIVTGIGVLLLALTLTPAMTPWRFVPALLVIGVGIGFALSSLFNIVLAAVEPHETGSASGTFTAVQQFAGALGVAILGTVYFGLLGDYTVAFRQTLWAVGVLLVLAFAAAYLLPKARTSWEAPSTH